MEHQKQIQNINIGSKIRMSFDLGKLEHHVYGNADLSGTIPLILPYGTYIEPTFTMELKGLETIVAKLTPEFRDLWYNELDKEVSAHIKHCLLIASYFNPIDDIDTIPMQAFFYLLCIGTAVDDVFDDINGFFNDDGNQEVIRNYRNSTSRVFNTVTEDTINNEMEIPIPAFEFIRPYASKLLKLCESSIQDFHKNIQNVKEASFDAICAILLNAEHADSVKQLSHTSKSLFSGYQAGMLIALEWIVLIRGVKVSDEISKDILFQRLRIAFAKTSHMMNDILGCGRDIRLNQVNDSSILSQVVHKGIPLQNVFDQTLSELVDEINDIRILGNILRQYYCDDKDLLEYINCTERMLDGQLYAYKQICRYGNLNIKIISND